MFDAIVGFPFWAPTGIDFWRQHYRSAGEVEAQKFIEEYEQDLKAPLPWWEQILQQLGLAIDEKDRLAAAREIVRKCNAESAARTPEHERALGLIKVTGRTP